MGEPVEWHQNVYLITKSCRTHFFQNEPLCNDWAKFTSYSSRLKRIYNLHENPFLHVNVFGTPEHQKNWWGKFFLMRIIRSPPICSWLVLTNFPKIGRDQSPLESVQDFLIKLDIKLLMHLLEISGFFSLNNVIIRLTKIINRADKNWVHF